MKIIINRVEDTTIENFADHYGLVMEVNERTNPTRPCWRWYASFKYCEVKNENGCLSSTFGDGETPEEAIKDYARNISLKNIIMNAYKTNRKEITVPELTEG